MLANLKPETSVAKLRGEILLESALLASSQGDLERARQDATAALAELEAAPRPDARSLAEARALAGGNRDSPKV